MQPTWSTLVDIKYDEAQHVHVLGGNYTFPDNNVAMGIIRGQTICFNVQATSGATLKIRSI
jgi:hypothetical protein